jgi:hypothetical protein
LKDLISAARFGVCGWPHRQTLEVIDFEGTKMQREQLGSKSAGEQFELLTTKQLRDRHRTRFWPGALWPD